MKSILDKDFVYTNASQTDITQVWRKYGWKPKNEIQINKELKNKEKNDNSNINK